MSNRKPQSARGSREYANPQIRVIGAASPPFEARRRLRLPGERRRLRLPFSGRQLLGSALLLAAVGGIATGIYFGVTALIESDDVPLDQAITAEQQAETEPAAADEAAQSAEPAAQEQPQAESAGGQEEAAQEEVEPEPAADDWQADAEQSQAEPEPAPAISPAQAGPSISEDPISPADLGGAPVSATRLTAESVPPGIPRQLADGTAYDPADATTVFSAIWPIGTTLRLTRLGGATLLNEAQQAQVVGTQLLAVVRGTEDSNADIQLSAAAFNQIAVYGVERIIAVQVEATAPPPR